MVTLYVLTKPSFYKYRSRILVIARCSEYKQSEFPFLQSNLTVKRLYCTHISYITLIAGVFSKETRIFRFRFQTSWDLLRAL